MNVDPELAQRVADGLAMPLPKASPTATKAVDLDPSPALRIVEGPRQRKTLEGRCVGILFADGSDPAEIDAVKHAVVAAKGKPVLIAPKVGGAKLKGGKMLAAEGQLAGTPSVTVDAIALVLAPAAAEMLAKDAAAVQFVMDAFGHLKAIGSTEGAKALLDKAGVQKDKGVTGLGADFIKAAGQRFWDREPKVRTLA